MSFERMYNTETLYYFILIFEWKPHQELEGFKYTIVSIANCNGLDIQKIVLFLNFGIIS